ncbi:MAG TPA: hypothetical protein EYH59_05615 [Pyrodictium sp.]|nr:hypothetical protein [Pyrodictium sp.]
MTVNNKDISAELILERAVRHSLLVLSPHARSLVMLLRSLTDKPKKLNDVILECETLRVRCSKLEEVADYLEELGLLERRGDEVALTEDGSELAASIKDVEHEIADLIKMFLEGLSSDFDIYVHLFTGVASIVGVIEGYALGLPLKLILPIHTYLSCLSASALALLARKNKKIIDILEKMFEEISVQGS